MDPDKFQQAWRAQESHSRITVDAGLLLQEVQHSQSNFRAMILRRDCVEIGIALVMLPLWFYLGFWLALPWTWYLTVPALLWVGGFLLVDRLRHRDDRALPGEPLLQSVHQSLAQVEHQIHLLRNVFWWYLLPFLLPMLAFFFQVAWHSSQNWWQCALGFALPASFVGALYYGVYWLNQQAVHRQLEPRRRQLLALIASLEHE